MNIIKLNTVDSTNDYIKRTYKSLNNLSIVFANQQTKGKGRNNHNWESEPNKNLLCSILIKNKSIIKKGPILSLLTAVAVVKTLSRLKLTDIFIKWPNDIYIKNKKICGILLESKSFDNKIEAIIIGIGLNLNQTKFNKKYLATSYKLEAQKEINIKNVLSLLIKEFKNTVTNCSNYISFINKHNFLYSKKIIVTINNKKVMAKALDIDKTGALKVKYLNKIYKINSNEVNVIYERT